MEKVNLLTPDLAPYLSFSFVFGSQRPAQLMDPDPEPCEAQLCAAIFTSPSLTPDPDPQRPDKHFECEGWTSLDKEVSWRNRVLTVGGRGYLKPTLQNSILPSGQCL